MMMRVVILGNSGSGKTTMARRLAVPTRAAVLSLDEIAWNTGPKRKSLDESQLLLEQFLDAHDRWVVEGCYADLLDPALDRCTELRFLNPGIEVCVANCRKRPWEPDKFESSEAQDQGLEALITWVQEYERRDDEFGLRAHRAVFDRFTGMKREYRSLDKL